MSCACNCCQEPACIFGVEYRYRDGSGEAIAVGAVSADAIAVLTFGAWSDWTWPGEGLAIYTATAYIHGYRILAPGGYNSWSVIKRDYQIRLRYACATCFFKITGKVRTVSGWGQRYDYLENFYNFTPTTEDADFEEGGSIAGVGGVCLSADFGSAPLPIGLSVGATLDLSADFPSVPAITENTFSTSDVASVTKTASKSAVWDALWSCLEDYIPPSDGSANGFPV